MSLPIQNFRLSEVAEVGMDLGGKMPEKIKLVQEARALT